MDEPPISPQDGPRGPPEGLKTAQEGPKTGPESPKTAQKGPKRPQKGSQEKPKRAMGGPQDGRWRPPRGPKMASEGPQRALAPQNDPRRPRDGPRGLQDGPKQPEKEAYGPESHQELKREPTPFQDSLQQFSYAPRCRDSQDGGSKGSPTSRSVPSQPFDASSCASTFAREKITFPSPLLRTGVQAHRANAVLARSRDSSKMSQSPVQTSTPPLLKHARPYCFPEKRLEQGAWREAPMQSCMRLAHFTAIPGPC